MDKEEKARIKRQIIDLRGLYTAYSNRDDVQRQRDAADTIENLLLLIDDLESEHPPPKRKRTFR